jgi:hypothetical protein
MVSQLRENRRHAMVFEKHLTLFEEADRRGNTGSNLLVLLEFDNVVSTVLGFGSTRAEVCHQLFHKAMTVNGKSCQ